MGVAVAVVVTVGVEVDVAVGVAPPVGVGVGLDGAGPTAMAIGKLPTVTGLPNCVSASFSMLNIDTVFDGSLLAPVFGR